MEQEAVTFQGIPIEFAPSHEDAVGRRYIFDPNAKIGPHTAVEFIAAMAGVPAPKPTFFIKSELRPVYFPENKAAKLIQVRCGTIGPLETP